MHRPILYFLLFAYVTTMLRPAIPYIADAAAHLLWYHEHIASVHSEHGKHHVQVEAEKENKKTGTENSSEENKKTPTVSEHSTSKLCDGLYLILSKKAWFSFDYLPALDQASNKDFPPPRC